MLNVPVEIQELFKQDSISKNFRVTFPNGEYRDLVNADFVSESVVFTDSISSDGTFKFGETESSVIEFQTYFDGDLRHKYIRCFIEIDISSLSESLQEMYGQTSSDVPFVYYSLPYGKFYIETSKRENVTGVRKVIAYSDKLSNTQTPLYMGIPEVLCAKLLWGLRIFNAYGNDYYVSKFHVDEGTTTSILFSKFFAGCANSCALLGSPEQIYNSTSDVFNDTGLPYDVVKPTGKIRCLSHTKISATDVPAQGGYYIEYDIDNTIYKICVKGKRVVFGDSKVSYYTLYNSNGVRFPMEQSFTKDIYTLPYTLDDSEDKIYEMSWDDNVVELSESDFDFSYVWERLHDTLPDLLKPSIRFVDWPTVTGYYPLSTDYDIPTTDAHIFPLNVNRKDVYNLKPVYAPVNSIPRGYVFGTHTRNYNRTNKDVPNEDFTEYHTKFAKLDDGSAEGFEYINDGDKFLQFNDDIQRANCNLSQRYVDIDVKTEGNHHSIVIDPSILVPDGVDLDDVDVQKSLYLRYFDTYGNAHNVVSGDIPVGTEAYARKQHIELFIPTDLVITKVTCPHVHVRYNGDDNTDPAKIVKSQCTKVFAALTDYGGVRDGTYSNYISGNKAEYQEIHIRDIYNPVLQQFDATNSEFSDLKLVLDYTFCYNNGSVGDNYSANINENHAPQYPSTSALPGTTYTFTGYSPLKYPYTSSDSRDIPPENMPEYFYSANLSKLFSAFSELTGQIVRLSRYDDSVEFCKISAGEYHNGETIPLLPGESTLPSMSVAPNTPEVKYLDDILQPGDNTLPSTSIYPSQPHFPDYVITPSDWRKVFVDDYSENVFYDKVSYTGEIDGEDVTISADVPITKIPEANYITYDISENWILTNYTMSAEQIQDIVDNLAIALSEIVYRKLNMTKRGLPFLESGDLISIVDANRISATVSCILKQRISGIQSLIATVENR